MAWSHGRGMGSSSKDSFAKMSSNSWRKSGTALFQGSWGLLRWKANARHCETQSPDMFFPKTLKVLWSRRGNGCEDTVTLLKSRVVRSCSIVILIVILAVLKLWEIVRVQFLNPWHWTHTTLPESHRLLASGQLVMAELLPTGVTSRRTTAHGHLLCLPVNLGVVLPKPGVSEDDVLPSDVSDCEKHPFRVILEPEYKVHDFGDRSVLIW
ncbi:hypothetical protein PTI98_013117 [Pleurotus ostreatus]|nr:hypothetical protein PTI98_013117 [Pleurotus ostreatus]